MMFSLILPSSSKTMSMSGTPNYSSSVDGRRADFSTIASGFPGKVRVQTLLRKTPRSLQSPAKSMKHEMDITSATERKLVKQLRASNTHSFVADSSTRAVNGKYQKLTDDWESKKLDLITGGRLLQDGLVYRQNISVRSFEIGGDRKMSFGALLNHLQDTALNQSRITGLIADGFGSTREMSRNNLIWVVSTLHTVVDRYPTWTDVVEVDTWMYASGKNGLGRDWIFRDSKTGETLANATSVYVMMNKKTRRLSKIAKEVRDEIEPYLMDCECPIINKDSRKILKLDVSTADQICTGLSPGWNDMDINQHVSNVKYIDWILESVPRSLMERYYLNAMTLEYKKECDMDSVLQSLSKMVGGGNSDSFSANKVIEYDHMLRLENGREILRGRTEWKLKDTNSCVNNYIY
ncbi:palmitoyl-acyl carrier protein thioesterase, chloroplastic [Populus alba]|uniref:palmitoyl-acyl carrier protein thioesterase, chloroplastic n=1 Tax=Populus alba TaxID=43335 RepID=UPI00158BC1DB|nr:palmitoyl-acyl carrier protein thioesterase, chloroplastic-like [Populus alba]